MPSLLVSRQVVGRVPAPASQMACTHDSSRPQMVLGTFFTQPLRLVTLSPQPHMLLGRSRTSAEAVTCAPPQISLATLVKHG